MWWSYALAAVTVTVAWLLVYLENTPVENALRNCKMAEAAPENREAFKSQGKSAFVVGYTGEVGKEVVKLLAEKQLFKRVVLIGRRIVNFEGEQFKNLEQKVVDFEKLDEYASEFEGLDVGICCLGTTRAAAGKEGFIRVDHDYIMKVAELSKAAGCKDFHLISSKGANKNSSFLYPKVKGQVEEKISNMDFSRVAIYRPAFLQCDRGERKRAGEVVIGFVLRPLSALFPTALTTPTTTVAKAVLNNAISPKEQKVELLQNKAIFQLAGEYKCEEDKSQ